MQVFKKRYCIFVVMGGKKKETPVEAVRSACPISCTLDLIGDRWSLLIIRDMLFLGKSAYNEFLESGEKISTNILQDKLKKLTALGLITYSGSEKRKKYTVTKMGRDLKPVLEAVGEFGMKHFRGSREYVKEQVGRHKQQGPKLTKPDQK